MDKKRIVCFGDSLTWGYDPEKRVRFAEKTRWPGVLQKELGSGWKVIEEGQNGRTIAMEDPSEGEKNGLTYIGPCLESHTPFDLLIIMLGSNDCKSKFGLSAMDIGGEMEIFLEKVMAYDHFRCNDSFKVLLVSPPLISDAIKTSWLGENFGFEYAVGRSEKLASWFRQVADMYHCYFLNAADHVQASDADGCHMDAGNQKKLGQTIAEFIQKEIFPE